MCRRPPGGRAACGVRGRDAAGPGNRHENRHRRAVSEDTFISHLVELRDRLLRALIVFGWCCWCWFRLLPNSTIFWQRR